MKFVAMAALVGMACVASAHAGGSTGGAAAGFSGLTAAGAEATGGDPEPSAAPVGLRRPAPAPNAASLGLGMAVLAARRARR